jgi:hypothetical protein
MIENEGKREQGGFFVFPGDNVYRNEKGELHNETGPAVIRGEDEFYFQNGKLHNDNGPAEVLKSIGRKAYYKNGELVRVEYNSGRVVEPKKRISFLKKLIICSQIFVFAVINIFSILVLSTIYDIFLSVKELIPGIKNKNERKSD